MMHRFRNIFCLTGLVIVLACNPSVADEPAIATDAVVRIANRQMQLGVDAASGTIRELVDLADGDNRVADGDKHSCPWQIVAVVGERKVAVAPTDLAPRIEHLDTKLPGLRLVWDDVPLTDNAAIDVTVEVCLDEHGSRWELSVEKPKDVRLKQIAFPRVPGIRPRKAETVAVPHAMGRALRSPRWLLTNPKSKTPWRAWRYPHPLSMQCLAYYEPGGPGLFAACDDANAYTKMFVLRGGEEKRVSFQLEHPPEGEADGAAEYRLPYAVVLAPFRGDWTAAAERYRRLPCVETIAQRARARRDAAPDWVKNTGLWVWNRGPSEGVLPPAVALQKHTEVPVSVLWHWWHDCAYDAGFPEYFPPREGEAPFTAALASAQREGVHAIIYMNQRLWGVQTESWKQEGAERWAVKRADGTVHTETYNKFMQSPCAPMCIATEFWRNRFAALTHEALCNLNVDGVYMDQTGVNAACYDPAHGHVVGPGRYWYAGLDKLTDAIRQQSGDCGNIALAGEFCVEPVMDNLDMMLALNVSGERLGLPPTTEVIPFVQAVYAPNVVTFGSFAMLLHPPYDERWPADKAPAEQMTLLDAKFGKQFCLEQARTFAWGMQPMIANFRPELIAQRPDEIDYLRRLVQTRQRAMDYLFDGVWLPPPALDVPSVEIDVIRIGTYLPPRASKRTCPVVVAGAWRAADGRVGIALAGINDQPLRVRLPIDVAGYGLSDRCETYRIDDTGRRREGSFDPRDPCIVVDLSARELCILEFCRHGAH